MPYQYTKTLRFVRGVNYAPSWYTHSMEPHDHHVQSQNEEIANSISHGVGVIAVLTGAPFIILAAINQRSAWDIVGVSVFVFSMLVLYFASTIYHALRNPTAKRVFRVLDHGSIYLLIAGTYTPFTLGALRGPWGWTLFGLVWGIAIIGITLKSLNTLWHPVLSNAIYLSMAWLAVIAAKPFWDNVHFGGVAWLLAGGIAYSGGVFFFNSEKRYAHLWWHLCVITGTVCHYFAVLWYAA